MTVAPSSIKRPTLTMPPEEAEVLRTAYREASVILEYGSGGSTALAAEFEDKHITSVESDRGWARMMKQWFAENPPSQDSTVDIQWVNIGETHDWGHPVSAERWRDYANYPLGVWKASGRPHPDVVLVDGRFRVGCALATAFNITRPVTLLFDDYTRRKWMHEVESFIGTPLVVGRVGVFHVEPTPVPGDRLDRVIHFMTLP
ncbi:hypothetical protein ACFORG_22365 [Lutimaribacter marinistellae]|uniref:Class I SAM-dependent methyltransferase n=1 Tax=Lutimaribacter marinistellae TaxID=1820329 RepID=A0ABV7TLI1_9RHOB